MEPIWQELTVQVGLIGFLAFFFGVLALKAEANFKDIQLVQRVLGILLLALSFLCVYLVFTQPWRG